MNQSLRVGMIGDFDPHRATHTATNDALRHAARALSVSVDCSWLPTHTLQDDVDEGSLREYDALWCAPGSPYKSMSGALRAIRFARESDWPFIGT